MMLFTGQFPTTGLDFKYVLGEIKELFEEIKNKNPEGIVRELCDVYTCSMCAIQTHFGISMPLFWTRSAHEYTKRINFFKSYLNQIGLEFKIDYLKYGANYLKKEKRMKAVELAIRDQVSNLKTKEDFCRKCSLNSCSFLISLMKKSNLECPCIKCLIGPICSEDCSEYDSFRIEYSESIGVNGKPIL